MTLLIQDFMRAAGSDSTAQRLEALKTRYGITARRHGRYENLVLLKYSMIDSPMGEPIVRECRGIILDEADDWRVVSMAMVKFFNAEEGHAAPLDWSTARVQEKLDGSLSVLYWYRGEWHVATSGTPDASGDVNGTDRFADYFWRTFRADGWKLPLLTGYCFFFELTGPANRIVVVHDAPRLTLLGARHVESLEEMSTDAAAALFDRCPRRVREYPLTSIEQIVASFAAISPLSQEGYVVVDDRFARQKIKHPGYVALHHAKDGMTTKAFVEIARAGETSEVIAAFPEFKPLLDDAVARVAELVAAVEADYARIKDIPEQKAFALEAVKTRCSAALFQIRAGKTASVRSFFAEVRIDMLMGLLGYKGGGDTPVAKSEAA